MDSPVINDLMWIGNGFANTVVDIYDRLYNVGIMRGLYKLTNVKSLIPTSKVVIATVNLLALPQLAKVGEAFGTLKDLCYAAEIFTSFKNLFDEDKNKYWYNTVSNILLVPGSICEDASFSKKFFGVTSFPFFSDLATQIGESSLFKSIEFPLLKHLFLNKLKDFFILANSIFVILVDHYLFWFGSDEKERERVISTKNILDHTCHLGRALLICFAVSYFAELPFRIMALFFAIVGQTKYIAFD